jgi:hypothetical protein
MTGIEPAELTRIRSQLGVSDMSARVSLTHFWAEGGFGLEAKVSPEIGP